MIESKSEDTLEDEVDDDSLIKVYMTGEINEPKIVEVKKGIILNDLINLCGGVTNNASPNINLVYEINDNVTIVIKERNFLEGIVIIDDIGDATVIDEVNGLISGKVNINTATAEQLLLLPGVGESTAGAIISYRLQHGAFTSIEEIMSVPGIKEAKYNLIKDLISTY
ncbi:MAG: helix-hairpin-helix domain-containing protein [Clostridia bacterium]|nr:helix-hairpin-helix domain-containing protein [Clostridia bacterium]